MKKEEERPVKLRNLIMYGSGDFFGGGSFLIIGMLYMYFLTEVAGLNPILAGLVFAVGKIWDALSDPLMGYISDNTHSRFGRRRLFFLISFIPIPISFVLLWFPIPFQNELVGFLYYSFAYVLFSTVFTMVMVPYASLNAEMTTDYKIRTRLSGARILFSQFSALLAGTIPKLIINNFPENLKTGHLVMAIVFGFLYAVPWLFVFFGTWELPYERTNKSKKYTIKNLMSNFGTIFINKSFRIHIVMYILAYSAMDILMALFAYYLTYYLGKEEIYPIAMGALLLTQIGMLPVYVMLSNKKGKGFAYMLGLSIWCLGMLISLLLTPQSSMFLIIPVCIIIGGGLSAGVMIPWAILPSITDVDELITSKKRAGTYAGAMTLIRKLVQGVIAMPLVGFGLGLIGYVPNQPQTEGTLTALKFFFMVGPFILLIAGIIIGYKFKINPKTHSLLIKEIERLKNGGSKEEVNEEVKDTCEKLTGIDYEDLYKEKEI